MRNTEKYSNVKFVLPIPFYVLLSSTLRTIFDKSYLDGPHRYP
jgi:hypothetical protein